MSESVERDLAALKPGAPSRRVPHPLYAQFDRGRFTRESARARLGPRRTATWRCSSDTSAATRDSTRCSRRGRGCARGGPVTLVVAGEFYEDAAPYRALVAAAGEGAVRLLDRYLSDDEVEALFKAADVVVLPYRSATQSGVTHVAYALGRAR